MKRSLSIPVVVLIAVIALVLGTFGSATAAGITKGTVKKIAAKVVTKKAPELSVAKAASATKADSAATATTATTATNATNLGGQPAGTYLNTTFKYRLPTQAATTERIYTFPGLPAGTYLFTYEFVATGGSADAFCYVRPTAANTGGEGFQYAQTSGGFTTVSSSGVIAATAAINMRCTGPTAFAAFNGTDVSSSVTFTKLDAVTAGSGSAARSQGAVDDPAKGTGPTS